MGAKMQRIVRDKRWGGSEDAKRTHRIKYRWASRCYEEGANRTHRIKYRWALRKRDSYSNGGWKIFSYKQTNKQTCINAYKSIWNDRCHSLRPYWYLLVFDTATTWKSLVFDTASLGFTISIVVLLSATLTCSSFISCIMSCTHLHPFFRFPGNLFITLRYHRLELH